MQEINKTVELKDKELKQVTGGLAFKYNQCPCNNFSPHDGNWNNKSTYNCEFFVKAQQISFDVCDENGVCRKYK